MINVLRSILFSLLEDSSMSWFYYLPYSPKWYFTVYIYMFLEWASSNYISPSFMVWEAGFNLSNPFCFFLGFLREDGSRIETCIPLMTFLWGRSMTVGILFISRLSIPLFFSRELWRARERRDVRPNPFIPCKHLWVGERKE